ncbi:MATE family efflux transporter [Ruminococcaceae bacterium OttesenSCG-928-I18]|nr:MATE family efflux transporter [Ruminococcaceae bacterium OttesenSCG-928-I18]
MTLEERPLHKEFGRFVVPSVIAQWVFALYTMVDGMFVARGVGELALAAVNIAMPFVNFTFALSLIIAVGTSTIVSIYFGQGNREAANRAYTQNIVTVCIASLAVTTLVLLNLRRIALFLGATPDTLTWVMQYVGTIACFNLAFMISYYFEILIKADGRPKMATVMVIIGAVLNCILDYLFVFVIEWGVLGAAVATGLSQLAVAVVFLVYFLSPKAKLRFARFRLSPRTSWRTLKLGLPSGITDFSAGMMIFLFNHAILTHISEEAIVSYTIVAYVNTIVVMSMTGVAQGFQPLVSYFYGRGQRAQCEKLLRWGLITAMALSVAIMVPTFLAAGPIVSIFISPEMAALREYSVQVFRIFSVSFLLLSFNITFSGYFTAIEREKSSVAISLARGFLLIALSLQVLTALFGGAGIWWAPTMSEGLCLVLTFILVLAYRKSCPRKEADETKLTLQPKKSSVKLES